jgi:hypothetical protein
MVPRPCLPGVSKQAQVEVGLSPPCVGRDVMGAGISLWGNLLPRV